MVVYTFSPSTQEVETGGFCEFEATLAYRMSSRTAKGTPSEGQEGVCERYTEIYRMRILIMKVGF